MTDKLTRYPELGIKVNSVLQQNVTPEDQENHIDIAPKYHDNVEAFIDEFELFFVQGG